jgi:3-dehydroquinate dehydratase-2
VHYATGHGLELTFRQSNHEGNISNIRARDEYHRHSKIRRIATSVICGLGPYGYIAAMHALAQMAKKF